MPTYRVPTTVVVRQTFLVEAESGEEAGRLLRQACREGDWDDDDGAVVPDGERPLRLDTAVTWEMGEPERM